MVKYNYIFDVKCEALEQVLTIQFCDSDTNVTDIKEYTGSFFYRGRSMRLEQAFELFSVAIIEDHQIYIDSQNHIYVKSEFVDAARLRGDFE